MSVYLLNVDDGGYSVTQGVFQTKYGAMQAAERMMERESKRNGGPVQVTAWKSEGDPDGCYEHPDHSWWRQYLKAHQPGPDVSTVDQVIEKWDVLRAGVWHEYAR